MKMEERSSTLTLRVTRSLAYPIVKALELSFVTFHAWESGFVVSGSLGCNIEPYVILAIRFGTLRVGCNLSDVLVLHVCEPLINFI
jgi:hypothetical protein